MFHLAIRCIVKEIPDYVQTSAGIVQECVVIRPPQARRGPSPQMPE
jgi:hypothetical protein